MKDRSDIVIDAAKCALRSAKRRAARIQIFSLGAKMARLAGEPFFRPTCELVDDNAHAGRRTRRCRCRAADDQLISAKIKRGSLRTKSSILVANLVGAGVRNKWIGRNHSKARIFRGTGARKMQVTAAAIYKLRVHIQVVRGLRRTGANAEPKVMIALDLAETAININLTRILLGNIVA